MQEYYSGIVGESHYQAEIRKCSVGEQVEIVREPDNAHDADAVVVKSSRGRTIGYLARDSWLRKVVHKGKEPVRAWIESIGTGKSKMLGVVLTVTIGEEPAEPIEWSPRPLTILDRIWALFGVKL